MKKLVFIGLVLASQSHAAPLTCKFVGETLTADWVSSEKLENVKISVDGETDPDLIREFDQVTGKPAARSNANIFSFDMDGHGSERKLYLSTTREREDFDATIMIYEDGVPPLRETAQCSVE